MGNKTSRAGGSTLSSKECVRYAAATGFDGEEVRALYAQFLNLKSDSVEALTLGEFQSALGFKGKESRFLERTFRLFDANHDGLITFEEFVGGIALLSPNALPEQKIKFTFQVYDLDGKSRISPANLRAMLSASLSENGLTMSEAQVEEIVAHTFRTVNLSNNGWICFDEYKAMVLRNPAMLKPLTLNVAELISQGRDVPSVSTTTTSTTVSAYA